MRRILPRTLRARLTLAFAAVVAIALALVLISLPRLLDDYFVQQEVKSLTSRAQTMSVLISIQLSETLDLRTENAKPIVVGAESLRPSSWTVVTLGRPDDPTGYLHRLTELVAQSDVQLTLSESADAMVPAVGVWDVPLTGSPPEPGQTSFSARVTATHCRRWSASAARPSSVST